MFSLQISAVLMFTVILENTFSTLIDPFRMFLNYDLFDNSSACCTWTILGFPGGSVVKKTPCNAEAAGDMGSIHGLGRSPGGGHGNPLQYS